MSIILIALAAAAQTVPASPAPTQPMRICRASEKQTGTHMRTGRRCKTAEEWAREDSERAQKPASLQVTEGQSVSTGAPSSPH